LVSERLAALWIEISQRHDGCLLDCTARGDQILTSARGNSCAVDVGPRAQKVQHSVGTIRSHRDLEAWQVAMDLVHRVYELTERFPPKEMYGLQGQLRRAAVSVPSNVAEAQARPLRAALNQLSIAVGSLAEVDTQMEIARRLNYVGESTLETFHAQLESTFRLVRGLGRAKKLMLLKTVAQRAGMLLLAFFLVSSFLSW
jgi:four helix bundle protein